VQQKAHTLAPEKSSCMVSITSPNCTDLHRAYNKANTHWSEFQWHKSLAITWRPNFALWLSRLWSFIYCYKLLDTWLATLPCIKPRYLTVMTVRMIDLRKIDQLITTVII